MIGVSARVIDRADEIDERSCRIISAAHDFHDDRIVAKLQHPSLFGFACAGAKSLHAALDHETGLFEQTIEREPGRRSRLAVQSDAGGDLRRQHGGVDGCGHVVNQPQTIETDQPLRGRIGKIVSPRRAAEAEQPVRGDAPLGFDGVGETGEIGGLATERRRRHEAAKALPAPDQPFVNQHLDGAADGESTNPETLRQRRLAVYALAGPLIGDLAAHDVDELQIKRPVQICVECVAHSPKSG